MKPFLIIYFSGVGNTKAVAEHIKICANKTSTEIYSMEKIPVDFSIDNHSAIIIGTPTYHSEPAKPLMKFLEIITLTEKFLRLFLQHAVFIRKTVCVFLQRNV